MTASTKHKTQIMKVISYLLNVNHHQKHIPGNILNRVVRILRQKILHIIFLNSAQILHTFSSRFFHFKMITCIAVLPCLPHQYTCLVLLSVQFSALCLSMFFFTFWVSFYFIIFTPKCFALAVAAVSDELRAISLNKTCKILQFLLCFVNSAHNGQFCAKLCTR